MRHHIFRKLKDAVPPNFKPEDRRMLFWVFPLALVVEFMALAHVVLHFMSVWSAISVQVLSLIGMLWIFVRALRRANRTN